MQPNRKIVIVGWALWESRTMQRRPRPEPARRSRHPHRPRPKHRSRPCSLPPVWLVLGVHCARPLSSAFQSATCGCVLGVDCARTLCSTLQSATRVSVLGVYRLSFSFYYVYYVSCVSTAFTQRPPMVLPLLLVRIYTATPDLVRRLGPHDALVTTVTTTILAPND